MVPSFLWGASQIASDTMSTPYFRKSRYGAGSSNALKQFSEQGLESIDGAVNVEKASLENITPSVTTTSTPTCPAVDMLLHPPPKKQFWVLDQLSMLPLPVEGACGSQGPSAFYLAILVDWQASSEFGLVPFNTYFCERFSGTWRRQFMGPRPKVEPQHSTLPAPRLKMG
ncbi:hypothetical protein STEG23_025706, partial [Scotinomys teguina]